LNRRYDRILHSYIVPKTGEWSHRSLHLDSPLLREGIRLEHLSGFYPIVKRVWDERLNPRVRVA
jgi:hypothetical protein